MMFNLFRRESDPFVSVSEYEAFREAGERAVQNVELGIYAVSAANTAPAAPVAIPEQPRELAAATGALLLMEELTRDIPLELIGR